MVAIPLCTLSFMYYRGLVLEYSLLKLKDFSLIPCEYFPVSVFFYIQWDFIIEKVLETLA